MSAALASVAFIACAAALLVHGSLSRRTPVLRWAMYTNIGLLIDAHVRTQHGAHVDLETAVQAESAWVTVHDVLVTLDHLADQGVTCRGYFTLLDDFTSTRYEINGRAVRVVPS